MTRQNYWNSATFPSPGSSISTPSKIPMSSANSATEKPNPFYQPAASAFMRREFLGLMTATLGWTFLPCVSAQDAKGKGGKGDDK